MRSNGRVTVPEEVRTALHLKPGTRLEWRVTADGDVTVRVKLIRVRPASGGLSQRVREYGQVLTDLG